jgi:hypothetical protein
MSAEINLKTTAEILSLIPKVGCERITGHPIFVANTAQERAHEM